MCTRRSVLGHSAAPRPEFPPTAADGAYAGVSMSPLQVLYKTYGLYVIKDSASLWSQCKGYRTPAASAARGAKKGDEMGFARSRWQCLAAGAAIALVSQS